MIEMVRLIGRWIAFLAILAVVGAAIIPNLPSLFGQPPVQMPGGPRTTDGVSVKLDGIFMGLDPAERWHFVVQFSRELSPREIDDISSRLGVNLDGPVPENAYITSTTAGRWTDVRDALEGGTPPAVKIFEFRSQDKLAPSIRDPNDPSEVVIPPYAMSASSRALVYVRFFDDVPLSVQNGILFDLAARQPDGSAPMRGTTGIWAVAIPESNIADLAKYDEVRFIEPTMPPVVEDMDQARNEVGAQNMDFDGAGAVIAQWEGCQGTVIHTDMGNRVSPIGQISFLCRDWQFRDGSQNGHYDTDEPIGTDLDEDGTIDLVLHPEQTPITDSDIEWESLPRHITGAGKVYVKRMGGDPAQVEVDDIKFGIDVSANAVKPARETVAGDELRPFVAERHPTLVAGIIISNSASVISGGDLKYPGLLPAATIRSHAWRHTSVIDEYVDAIAHGASISSNSFGWKDDYHHVSGADPYNTVSQFYDEVASGRHWSGLASALPARMLIVGSSGNEGDHSKFWRTARIVNSAKNVIAVGSVSSSEEGSPGIGLGVPAHDSGRGPTMYGRLTPILSAPGDQLKCLASGGNWACDSNGDTGITSTIPVDDYDAARGTSFSTPIVSGAAGLLSHEYETRCNFAPAPQDLRALLVHSAKDLTRARGLPVTQIPSGAKLTGPDFVFGYGLLRVNEAAEIVRHAITDVIESGWVEHRVLVNSTDQLVNTPGGPQLRVTLVWDDPPYFTEYPPRESTGILQNDIDLEVIDPFGNRHMPWVLNAEPGHEADPAKHKTRAPLQYVLQKWRDHRNTIEQVVVDVTPAMMNRTWTIRVREHEIRQGPQAYTLVSEAFQTMPSTDCGDFSNGTTVKISDPLDVPDTPFAWALFWIAVIILIWLTFEVVLLLYQTASNKYGALIAYLMIFFLLLLLFVIFRLLVVQNFLVLAYLVLVGLAYVLWRATQP